MTFGSISQGSNPQSHNAFIKISFRTKNFHIYVWFFSIELNVNVNKGIYPIIRMSADVQVSSINKNIELLIACFDL